MVGSRIYEAEGGWETAGFMNQKEGIKYSLSERWRDGN